MSTLVQILDVMSFGFPPVGVYGQCTRPGGGLAFDLLCVSGVRRNSMTLALVCGPWLGVAGIFFTL